MSELPPPDRTSHPFWMYDMIKEIPVSFRAALEQVSRIEVPQRSRIVFTGNGTAYYSAWMGAQVLDGLGVQHAVIQSFELENYESPSKDDVVVGVSHSGITKTTVDSLRAAKGAGAYTVGVTHFGNRPIEDACDAVVVIGNGPDKSRCHTKTFVDSAAAVAKIALAHARRLNKEADGAEKKLDALEPIIQRTIEHSESWAKKLVNQLPVPRQIVIAAGGPNVVTAKEAALKIKESSYLPAEGIELEEEMHGPWVNLGSESLLVVVAPVGKSTQRARDLLSAAGKIGATSVAVGGVTLRGDYTFYLPDVEETLSPFITIIPLYFFAYFLSVKLGHNPDYLRYLEPSYWDARSDIFPPGTH
jgi:glutamine---fructose-6-phosphate transaminase (isomerizing)